MMMTDVACQYYWRSETLGDRSASEIFAGLFYQPNSICTLLESPFPSYIEQPRLARYSICAGPPAIVEGIVQLWTPKVGEILPFLRGLLAQKNDDNPSLELPFVGGWLGWLGYDLAGEVENLPSLKGDYLPFPVAYWYAPESFAVLDHHKQILWLASQKPEQLEVLGGKLKPKNIESKNETLPEQLSSLKLFSQQEDYENAVTQALNYIRAGDIFQANLSLRFAIEINAEPWEIYRRLTRINPSPFASYWQTPWGIVISCSPERLVQLEGKIAQTRPIAGTRPRTKNPDVDKKMAQELLENSKEIAEHIMLVDLERNDLGRVCEWGSVKVEELLSIENYSHVMHLVSNVVGILRSDHDCVDLIQALFPGGTITGCPKVRCLEIIEELEPVRRSLFYGSCGYLDKRGNLDLNILIRTLLLTPNGQSWTVSGQVGAGIVADSNPTNEWQESLQKAKAQLAALGIDNIL